MTRKEFSSKSDALKRLIGIGMPGFFALIFCLTFAIGRNELQAILLLIALFGGLFGLMYLEWHLTGKWGLRCPKCGERFMQKTPYRVLLSGTCPKCKNDVFDDLAPVLPLPHGLNREEFKAELERVTKNSSRRSIRLLVIYLAAMFSFIPVAKFFQRYVERGGLDWVTLTELKWFAGLTFGAVALLFVIVFVFAIRGKFGPRGLPCPECGRALAGRAGKAALETGGCIYCGCGLFEAPTAKN